jgi:dTDP-4-dehydrorhamnose reductase
MVVTGVQGQVVTALVERGAAADDIDVVTLGRPVLDLADPAGIDAALTATRPDVIVSAAAYTAVDKAESEPDLATTINGEAPGAIARAAARLAVPIIHISTDYVFDGSKDGAYLESDPVSPLGVYGQTKLAGEQAVAAATPDHAILRTAWVYSPFGNNFVKTMLRLANDRPELGIVSDQQGAPTSALDIADAVIAVTRQLLARPHDASLRGVFHMSGTGYTDWASFAEAIFAYSAEKGGPAARVNRLTTSQYPTPAARPANSRLDNGKLAKRFGVQLPEWQTSLKTVIDRLL